MSSPLLVGLFGAWAAVQVALGGFFLQAYYARRREQEYLLFALVCFAFAVTDAGLSLVYSVKSIQAWELAATVVHAGIFSGAAFTVHFTLRFVAPARLRTIVRPTYGFALVLVILVATGAFWSEESLTVRDTEAFGFRFVRVVAHLTVVGASGYTAVLVAIAWCVRVLVSAYRAGRTEVRGAIVGLGAALATGVADALSVSGLLGTPALLPYGFLIYGFGVADTLLVRYRRAADDLEKTANELRNATEELTSSYLELSVVQEELFKKKQLASVGELAASIAHEVRNPLAIIVNAAANLKRPLLGNEDRSTLFDIIQEEITRLNGLVTELLRYARPMNVRREDVSLPEVLRAVSEKLEEKYTFDVHLDEDPEVETVWADPALLRLALTNLVDNARQAMPGGGAVVVIATKTRVGNQNAVRIEVSDTGQGMDSRTLRRALDPFFSTRPSGTGLGLPIAGRIVEAHGGKLEFRSRPGEGTTVTLVIPSRRLERHSEPRLSVPPRA